MASTLCAALFACRPAQETHVSGRGASAAGDVAASNRHDLNGLLANLDDSTAVFLFGEPDVVRTRAAIRPPLSPMFHTYSRVHTESSRRVIGEPFVADQGPLTGVASAGPAPALDAEAPSVPTATSDLTAASAMARPFAGLNEHDAAGAAYGDATGLGTDQIETLRQRRDDPEILYASPP